eukprot:5905080-Pyramimonas_sp.AAC.2
MLKDAHLDCSDSWGCHLAAGEDDAQRVESLTRSIADYAKQKQLGFAQVYIPLPRARLGFNNTLRVLGNTA